MEDTIYSNWGTSDSSVTNYAGPSHDAGLISDTSHQSDSVFAMVMDSNWNLYVAQGNYLTWTRAGSNWNWGSVDSGSSYINTLTADESDNVYGGWGSGYVGLYQWGTLSRQLGSNLP